LVFDEKAKRIGKRGGIEHFGFRLRRPQDVDLAAKLVAKAGGKILDKGEFCPGEPYLYCSDPDGYVVEIWYELPTPLDPRRWIRKLFGRFRGKNLPRRTAPARIVVEAPNSCQLKWFFHFSAEMKKERFRAQQTISHPALH
jgi:hypothetical protein